MKWIVGTSLRIRVAVVAVTALLLVIGTRVLSTTAFDVFPEFAPPLVEIQTETPGLSVPEVEALVTVPLENALNGTSWLKTVRSKSVLGLSSVVLYFAEGTELMKARQLVQERLAQVAPRLPSVAKPPVILSPLSSTSRVMKIGLSSKTMSQMDMTTIAKWTIRPRLMAVAGVANVAVWGQRDRQIQALIDPHRLLAHDVTVDDVLRATREAAEIGGGGFIDTPNQRLAVSHVSAIHGPEDLKDVPVAWRNGAAVRLGDVARLVEGFPAPIGDAVINDGPGLLLIVEKQPWGNTLAVTRQVESALEELRPGLAGLEIDPTIFRPATFIEMAIANLQRALLIGCVLVILVLAFFLYDWRTALISVLAIPASLIAAALILRWRVGVINTMVLAGMVIALGEVVDDAIIDVENIMRRLRLNRGLDRPRPAYRVVLEASVEVRSAVVYGSVIIILVLLPVFFLPGLAGSFFRPLAVTYILAILASLAVALTLTPALSLILLPRGAARRREEAPHITRLKSRYGRMLRPVIARPGRAFVACGAVLLLTLAAIPFLGEEFLPHFKEYDFLMHWVEKPGTSLEAMARITERASKELRAIPGVRNFGAHIGRAEVADEVVGPNFTELWISLDPKVDYDATVARIQSVVDGYPGLYRDLLTYLRERIKEVLTGVSATLVVRIYGPDLDVLRQKAEEVKSAVAGVAGVADLKVQPQVLVPQVEVRLRPEAAARFGLTPGEVRRAASTLIKGAKVGEFYEEQKVFDIAVWGEPAVRSDVGAVRDLPLRTPSGGLVPLRDVADVVVAPMPNQIAREAASRYAEVTCNVRGRDLGRVARDIEGRVKAVAFGGGYHPEFLGEYAAQKASKNRILLLSLVSLIGIFLILQADFGTARPALLILLGLPFALVGGVVGVWLTGGVLSLGSLVGFVTVLGVAARNGIMLISHYRHLEREEGAAFGPDFIVRGAQERLAPILMTALAAALALMPIVVGGNRPGQEIEHPMAIVIVGGLVSSTALNLFVLPALFWKYGRGRGGSPAGQADGREA
ncbi:MAG TPA: efflux RND transporter permease subunit [Candidatus Aminicenantes bacterium]|nr:efflux RND transporter permease subunit [Candidatus Aminicenantes bacterium]